MGVVTGGALRVVSQAPAGGWTPADITGLGAWYDASDLASLTLDGSGYCSEWRDLSGNGRHLSQGTGSAQPRSGVRTQNGLPVLDFDGNDSMSVAFSTLSQPNTVLAVVVTDRTGSSDTIFDATHPEFRNTVWAALTNIWYIYAGNSVDTTRSTPPGARQITILYNGASSKFYENGTQYGGALDAGGLGMNGFRVGGNALGGAFLDGALAELVLINGLASDDDIAVLSAYCAAKWGL